MKHLESADKIKKILLEFFLFFSTFRQITVGGFVNLGARTRGAINSLPASGEFCHLAMIFTNSLDLYQALHNVGPDLDPSCLTP